jgi:hypothetical protein
MKHFKLFVLALVLAFTANIYSQWSYCPGSVQMTGLGTYPTLYVVNANTCWVVCGVGGSPRAFKTTNGGANFVNASGNLTGPELYAVCGLSDQIAFAGDGGGNGGTGGNARLLGTTNGGTTWTTILTTGGTAGFFNGIVRSHTNPNFLFAQSDAPTGSNPFIAVSSNAGANWSTSTPTTGGGGIGAVSGLYCVDAQFYGFGMSATSRYTYTINGGSSWTFQNLSVTGTFTPGAAYNTNKMNGIFASSTSLPNIGRVTGGPGSSMSTVNTGAGPTGLCVMRYVPNSNICFLSAASGTNGIKISLDNGATWTQMTTAGLTGWNDISVTVDGSNIVAYAVAGDGSVIKLVTPVGINPINNEIPSKFILEQNYPNPFNPSTVVKYSVPKDAYVTLKVFNSVGQEVKTIVSENQAAGNYQQIIDLDGFSSGVYFYSIVAGDFKDTKKMILVK